MTNRGQILISVLVVVGAAAAVAVYTLRSGNEAASPVLEGHDHSAMLAAAGDALNPVALDPEGARRIGVTYATAMRIPFRRVVSTVGNVTWDETRLVDVSPKIDGWVEHLYIDFTGAPIEKDQPLLAVYSPMLVSAQEELILAHRLAGSTAGSSERAGTSTAELLEAARRRLRYWDIPDDEIARIEREGVPQKTLVLRAPSSGIVVEKNVVEGARIMPGTPIYRIADLSRVWIEGEVFEKDLSLVRLGQRARVTFEAYPGEEFSGTVTYVYPTVSTETRTGRVRLELANPRLRLKPGMYARLEFATEEGREALMIPRDAVHYTGARTIVFVRDADGMLIPREITTGLSSADGVEVLAGLAEGEVIVSSANFLIDAESNMGSSMQGMQGMDEADSTPAGRRDGSGGHEGH